jgi:hypothetical protein
MSNKKRVHLQQFGKIHLSNPDLIYIRNPERNKMLFMSFHLLKTYIKNPSLLFISFITLPPTGKRRWHPRSVRAYTREEVSFAKFQFWTCWFAKLLETNFFSMLKLDGCQVDLPSCWTCSYNSIVRAQILYLLFYSEIKNLSGNCIHVQTLYA